MTEQSLPQESIFLEALDIHSPAERAAYLDRVCGDDRALRAEVEALVRADEQSGDLLDLPANVPVTVDEPIPEAPGNRIGPYKLLEQIGEGGFGVVFMAEQMEPVRRRVALKVLKPGMDTRQVIARFEAERQALALMNHPNIAQVLDAGATESRRPYFVMELVHGVPLTEYCDQNQLTIRERLELFIAVCQAVQHAHQKGIIHRDIKPSNVLVTRHDGTPVPKVIDFGIAKAASGQLTDKTLFTGFAQMIGTPLYMSPEQAEMGGLDIDTRSDIYSLGVLLYELLTGTTPFEKQRLREAAYDEIRRIIREEEPPRPSMRISTLAKLSTEIATQRKSEPKRLSQLFRGELDWIVMKALEKDRTRRYETASSFAADVQRYLDDEPVWACPPSLSYRFRKFLRRHEPVVTAAISASFLGLLATVAVLVSMNVQLQREKKIAVHEKLTAIQAKKDIEIGSFHARRLLAERRLRIGSMKELLEAFQVYWHSTRQDGIQTITYAAGVIDGIAVSPDGQYIASAHSPFLSVQVDDLAESESREHIQVWDTLSGKKLFGLRHPLGVYRVAFSPEGRYLISAGYRYVKIWDLTTRTEVRTVVLNRQGTRSLGSNADFAPSVWDAVFSPDGRRIATAGVAVKLWDAATGSEALHVEGYLAVAFSPDGRFLASPVHLQGVGLSTEVTLYDADTGRRIAGLQRHVASVPCIRFSPDGRYVASAGWDNAVKVAEVASTREVHTLIGHSDAVTSVAYSPDGKHLASAGLDGTVRVWDATAGKEVAVLRGHLGVVDSVAFTPDGTRLISAGGYLKKGEFKIWQKKLWEKLIR